MALIETLSDNFNDNSTNTGLWTVSAATGSVSETGGHLVISPPVNTVEYDGYISQTTYTFTGSQVTISCIQTLNVSVGCEQQLALRLDGSNGFFIFYSGAGSGSLYCRITTAGTASDVFFTWDPVAMKWWRLRESAGTVFWETSPDGNTWTIQRTSPYTFAITSIDIEVNAGTYQAVASPGTAIFDSLNVVKTSSASWFTA